MQKKILSAKKKNHFAEQKENSVYSVKFVTVHVVDGKTLKSRKPEVSLDQMLKQFR